MTEQVLSTHTTRHVWTTLRRIALVLFPIKPASVNQFSNREVVNGGIRTTGTWV